MRPASQALRPAMTASRIASAINTASAASAIAVFMSTPSAPSSMAIAASDAVPRSDRSGKRHHSGGSRVNELARCNQVVVRVRKHDKAFLDEDAGSFDQLLGVREKRLLIPNHFQLDPVRKTYLAGEASGANRFLGGVARGGVGQDE